MLDRKTVLKKHFMTPLPIYSEQSATVICLLSYTNTFRTYRRNVRMMYKCIIAEIVVHDDARDIFTTGSNQVTEGWESPLHKVWSGKPAIAMNITGAFTLT